MKGRHFEALHDNRPSFSGQAPPSGRELWLNSPDLDAFLLFYHLCDTTSAQTKQVATQIDLNGTLNDPNVSNWQAFVEVVKSAFLKAILPGFDRQVQTASTEPRANNGKAEP